MTTLRRSGWDLTSSPPKPKIELSAPGPLTENRWRRQRNASLPPLFDDATIGCASAASLPATASAQLATWLCLGDEQGRIVVADLARPTSKRFVRGGEPQARIGIKIAMVAAIGATRWLVAVDSQGQTFVWKADGDLPSLALVNNALLNMGITIVGAACHANGLIAFVAANPAGGTAKLLIWDPTIPTSAANPVTIANLPQVTPANVRAVSLVADGADIILAIAHSSSPAVVLRGTLQIASWQLTPLAFAAPVTARLVSVAVINGIVTVVTVESDKDCKIWRETTANNLTNVDSMAAPTAVAAVAIGAWPADPWLRPAPVDRHH